MDKEIGEKYGLFTQENGSAQYRKKPRNTITDLGLELTWCGILENLLDNMITKKSKLKGQNLTT